MGGLAAAMAFTWFGMVAAISFLETPLKLRAPAQWHAWHASRPTHTPSVS
jgi:hypothetical protein